MEKQKMTLKVAGLIAAGLGLALTSFSIGRSSVTPQQRAQALDPTIYLVQNDNDPRELIPLPGQGLLPGQGEGECPLYLYQDGQLFQFNAPGQPGQPGQPGGDGSPELFPLEPRPQPGAPSTPSGPRNMPGTQLSQAAPFILIGR